ncbi:MAG: multicopper oxidase domain-containing protein [Candidatus Eremiobacteraeota bacterium]|nr:multicopper oxidase domain-containing protein [Candidatus Eremiobacteraeota bacterium]
MPYAFRVVRVQAWVRAVAFREDEGREGQVEAFGKEPGETTSGGWLMHCHINEHSALGMATFLNLREQ